MNEIEDVTSFYKPGMSCGLKIASYKISSGTEEDSKERSHDNDSNKGDFRWFLGWSIDDVPYSEVIDIDSNRVELSPKEDLIISECQPSIQTTISKIGG